MIKALISAGVIAALVGCQQPSASPAVPAASPSPEMFIGDLQYSCGRHSPHAFDARTLLEPGSVDQVDVPLAVALREFLSTSRDGFPWLPAEGWHLVGGDDESAAFVASLSNEPGYATVSLEKEGDAWRVSGWSTCILEAVLDGLGIATWALDPEQSPVSPEATQFVALVTERACAGGASSEDRVVPPLIFYGEREILIVFGVEALSGPTTCPANPPTTVDVELKEPIGERVLLDGALLPPRSRLSSAMSTLEIELSGPLVHALRDHRRHLIADDRDRSELISQTDCDALATLVEEVAPLSDEINDILHLLEAANQPLPAALEDLEVDLNSLGHAGVEARDELLEGGPC